MTDRTMIDFIKGINKQKADNKKQQAIWAHDEAMIRHLKQRYQELNEEIKAKVMLERLINDYSAIQMQPIVFNDRKSSKELKN